MAGVRIEVELSGSLAPLQRRIGKLATLDRHKLLDAVGIEVERQTRRRIATEKTSPQGQPWAPLSPRYEAYKKRKSSGGILEFEGFLRDTVQHLTEADAEVVGSGRVYAAIHQFGGAEVGRPGLPARPYLGLSRENEADVLRVVEAFLDRTLGLA